MNLPEGFELVDTPSSTSLPEGFELVEPEDEGKVMAAGRGALRNFPFAQQATAATAAYNPFAEKSDYESELKHLTEKAEAAKAQHPVAYGTGAVGGAMAPLLIPGVGEAMAASYPSAMAANAGLAIGSGTSDINALKNPSGLAKEAAISGGIGAVTGGAGKYLGELAKPADDFAAEAVAKGMGTKRKVLRSLFYNEADPEARMIEYGQFAKEKGLINYTQQVSDRLKKVIPYLKEEGKKIGAIIDKVNPEAAIPKADVTKDLYALKKSLATTGFERPVSRILKTIENAPGGEFIPLKTLHTISSDVGEQAREKTAPEAIKRASKFLKDIVYSSVDNVAKSGGDPKLTEALRTANYNYRMASGFRDMARDAELAELGQAATGKNNLASLASIIGGVASGNAPLGVAGAIASKTVLPMAELAYKNAMMMQAPNFPKIAKAIPAGIPAAEANNFIQFLRNKYGKK